MNVPPRSLRSLPPRGRISRSGRPFPTERPPTLAPLAAPEGADQSVGAALPDWDERPPTLARLAAPEGADQSVGAALPD